MKFNNGGLILNPIAASVNTDWNLLANEKSTLKKNAIIIACT